MSLCPNRDLSLAEHDTEQSAHARHLMRVAPSADERPLVHGASLIWEDERPRPTGIAPTPVFDAPEPERPALTDRQFAVRAGWWLANTVGLLTLFTLAAAAFGLPSPLAAPWSVAWTVLAGCGAWWLVEVTHR